MRAFSRRATISRLVSRGGGPPPVFSRGAKKTPATFLLDVLFAEFERLLFRMAPEQRVAAGLRSGGDPAADRLEDLGAAEIGNHEAEQESVAMPMRLTDIRSRTGDPLDHSPLGQLAQCAADCDP